MTRTREPQWLTRAQVKAIHDMQILQHGGLPGIRDENALESALGRPRHRWHYGVATHVTGCAAAYAFGLARNHPFSDGNKRTAFVAMATFLERNGLSLTATEPDAVATMLALAEGTLSEEELGEWLRDNSKRRRP
jgi:death-on-curing protein